MQLIKPVSKQASLQSATSVAPTLAERFDLSAPKTEEEEVPVMKSERLFSLDFLRGLDIFFLTVFSMLLFAVDRYFGLPKWIMTQLSHPNWVGFTVYDMIMPLFIFMCGAALPLALPKYLNENGHASFGYWWHVLKRVAMLWVLGMIAQGELFSYDLHRISFFNNTLQTIAVGYLITAFVACVPSKIFQIAVPFVLAAGYTVFLHLCGDMTPTGNAAVVYEVKFLELFYPHPSWHPVKQIVEWHYTWWTTIPMFGAMGLAGYHATKILMAKGWDQQKKASVQALVGLVLVGLGFALMTFDPCVKHIFTASFTSIAMGVSFILYAICYTIFDIRKLRFGTSVIMLFGRHSLLAYMLVETCFNTALLVLPTAMLSSLSKRIPECQYGVLFAVLQYGSVVLALYVWDWYKRGKSAAAKAAKEALEKK